MKKVLIFLFCAVMCVALVACGEGSGETPSENINGQLGDVMNDVNSESNEDTFAGENETGSKEDVPEHIQNFYNLLKEYTENNEVSFYLEGNGPFYEDPYFCIEINDDPDNLSTNINFHVDDEMKADKSFFMFFNIQEDNQMVKDFICAALYATNPQKSVSTIKKEMQELVNSCNEETYSIVLDNGDCVFFLEPVNDILDTSTLHVRYKDEYYLGIDPYSKDDYSELIFENALSEMNKGDRVYFSGKAIESGYEDLYGHGWKDNFVKIELEDGKIIYVTYDFKYSPVQFDLGKVYSFYGIIMDITDLDAPSIKMQDYTEQ